MRFKGLKVVLFATALFAAAAAPAHASSILGNTIQGGYYFPSSGTPYSNGTYSVNPFIVGAGVESVLTVDGFASTDVDFDAFSLVLTPTVGVNYTSSSFNGPFFTVLSGNPFSPIISVVSSGGQNVTAALVGGVLEINWAGQSFAPGDTITVTFDSTNVPEPGTLLLLGTGLAAVVARRRLKKRA